MGLSSTKEDEMAATKSRATRAAEKAEQDRQQVQGEAQDQDQEDQDEEQEDGEQSQPEAQPELPAAAFDLGRGRIVYYRPSLTLPDAVTVDCPHAQWGHGSEKAAMACLRKMAAGRGVELARP
jgi:hypothetical protein